jgi:hypothetical protein
VVWECRHICRLILRAGCKRVGHPLHFSFISGQDGLLKSQNLFVGEILHPALISGLTSSFPSNFVFFNAAFFEFPRPESSVAPITELVGVRDAGSRMEGTTPFLIPLKNDCTWSSKLFSSLRRADLIGLSAKICSDKSEQKFSKMLSRNLPIFTPREGSVSNSGLYRFLFSTIILNASRYPAEAIPLRFVDNSRVW